jgi:hypothetical protein
MGRSKELNDVAVRILEEQLQNAIRSFLAREVGVGVRIDVLFPFIEVIDPKGEMIAAIV